MFDTPTTYAIHRHDQGLVVSPRKHGPVVTWITGDAQRASPLAWVRVLNRMEERIEQHTAIVLRSCDQVVVDGDPCLRVTLGVPNRGIEFVVRLTCLAEGELSVTLPMSELREHNDIVFRVASIDLLPELMGIDAGQSGRFLVPINTGAIVNPAGKPRLTDRWLIYGEQSRWELMPMLPVTGVQRDNGGVAAIAVGGAEESGCMVATDGAGGGRVGLFAHLRSEWVDPVAMQNRTYRFTPLAAGRDIVVAAGRRLHRHIAEDLGKPRLETRVRECPDVAYLLDAYIMKLFHGVQRQGMMIHPDGRTVDDQPQFVMTMPFEEAGESLRRLRAAGLDRVLTQSVGWNPRGHDGLWPTRWPIESRLGGEAGLRQLIHDGQALGYRMTLHDNHVMSMLASPDHQPDACLWSSSGSCEIKGFWGGGYHANHWGLALTAAQIEDELARLRTLGIDGPHYLDGMGNPLYVNHHPAHRGPRTDYARGINRFLHAARERFGSVATECGFLYCSLIPDLIVTHGEPWHAKRCSRDWPITQMVDELAPVWQIALSGLVMHESQGLSWHATLEAALFAGHPRDEWSTRPGVMPVLDDDRIARQQARYEINLGLLGRLQLQAITDYALDGSWHRSVFEDGTVIEVDFSGGLLVVDGQTVETPDALQLARPSLAHAL